MISPKGRILCTEDDADTRDLLSMILTIAGYEVVCTGNPRKALQLARSQRWDLYLVDNWMPLMSGAALVERIREFDIITPALFCSGAGYQSDIEKAARAGGQGYLVKPIHNEVLLAEIERLIKRSSTRSRTVEAVSSVERT
jgi:DNA-binding response OmpR family regulator